MGTCPTKRTPAVWKWWAPPLMTLLMIGAVVATGSGAQDPGGDPGQMTKSCWNKTELIGNYQKVDAKECDNKAVCIKYSVTGKIDCKKQGNEGCTYCLRAVVSQQDPVTKQFYEVDIEHIGSDVVSCGNTKDDIAGQFFRAESAGARMKVHFYLHKSKCEPPGAIMKDAWNEFDVPSS